MLKARVAGSIPFQKNCEFCDEFTGGLSNAFYARYKSCPKTRFVLSTDNFHAFPSIGQLFDGYLLIAPKMHYASLDEMPRVLWPEFEGVYQQVRAALSNLYGPCISYEHGARQPSGGGCGIYHAHLHATPLAGISDPVDALKLSFPYTELGRLSEISERTVNVASYLFYQDLDARLYLFDTGPLPSQYMRKLLADALGDQDWNWRKAGREERLLATIERLSEHFNSTYESARAANL
jgi:diadenosine tetraphosphate (Ap4A) HIT family hydrolase